MKCIRKCDVKILLKKTYVGILPISVEDLKQHDRIYCWFCQLVYRKTVLLINS